MNTYTYSKHDRYNRGVSSRPTSRYSLGYSSRNRIGGNHYVSSEATESIGHHDQEYYSTQAYPSHNLPLSDHFPIDERLEDLKYQFQPPRLPNSRTPGYVPSFDSTPSEPLPHSSLTSAANDPLQYSYEAPTGAYYEPVPAGSYGFTYDDMYNGDWSSDGSSDSSQGYGRRHYRYNRTPHVGQRRMTELGREVFNGLAWVSDDDYADQNGVYMPNANGAYYYPRRY